MAVSVRQCESTQVTPCECIKNKTPAYNLPSMARFLRFLLACIVMFAVPVQGFASTTMLLCGDGAGHHASVTEVATSLPSSTFGGHDHTKHGHGTHNVHVSDLKVGDTGGPSDLKASSSNASHKCGACASCCHLVAISETAQTVFAVPLPQSALTPPSAHVASLPAIVPDKPPRA